MFTGIIEALGEVTNLQLRDKEWRLQIKSQRLDFSDVVLGDSIAVNGVCLTIQLTTLKNLQTGSRVNLEKALTPSKRLGGHIVSGHVDGVGELVSSRPDGASIRMDFKAPDALAKYIAQKGSICIDGTSLTVNTVKGAVFSINVIPHTQTETIIQDYKSGQLVNLEVDIISRYLERLMLGDRAADENAQEGASKLTRAFLAEQGF